MFSVVLLVSYKFVVVTKLNILQFCRIASDFLKIFQLFLIFLIFLIFASFLCYFTDENGSIFHPFPYPSVFILNISVCGA